MRDRTPHHPVLKPGLVAVAAALCLGMAHAEIITTGDIGAGGLNVGPGDTDLGTLQLYIGLGLPGSLAVDGGSQLLAGGITFGATANGTGTISGAGTLVNLLGSGNRVEVGNAGVGSLTVSGGAVLQARNSALACGACFNLVGNGTDSNGTFTVTGAGSTASLWALVVGNPAVFAPPASASSFGTPGGVARGTVNVLNGGTLVSLANTLGGAPGGSSPTGSERSFASVLVSGTGSTWRVTSNLVNGIDASVTMASHRNATAEMQVRDGGQLLLDAVPGRFSSLAVGQFGRADVVVDTGGRIVYGAGASGLLQIGRNTGAQGSMLVQSGGVVSGVWYTSLGRDGGTGTLTVDGAGSLFRADGDTTLAAAGGAGSFVAGLDVGRNGGTGTLNVRNGGRVELVATQSRSNSPNILVGRDAGSVGSLNISGAGSTVYLSAASTLPGGGAAEARNPLVRVGSLGTGVMNISGGGALVMQGNAVSTTTDSRSTSLIIGGVGDTASGGTGVATVSGAGSNITQLGIDGFIGVGMGAGASGVLNVNSQGSVNGMIINVGRSGAVGVMNVDNASINLAGQQTGNSLAGAGFSVGSGGGTGVLNLSNGARLTIDNAAGTASAGINIGGSQVFPGGQGVVTLSGGSRIDIFAPAGLGGISVGRSGTGTLRLSDSQIDTHGNGGIVIARDAGSVGTLVMTDGSTISTDFVGVGRNRVAGVTTEGGIATLVVNNGSTVTANSIEIGAQGYLGGNGTLVGNIVNYGVVNPGNSPGTLVIDGSFVNASGGRIVLEVESDGSGGFVTDHLIFTETSTVDLHGTQLVFSFLKDTDPNAFRASGGFDIDNFIRQQTPGGGTQALADAVFDGVSFAAESQAYTFRGFSYSAAGGASFSAVPVPEPATWASLALGLGWLALSRRSRADRRGAGHARRAGGRAGA